MQKERKMEKEIVLRQLTKRLEARLIIQFLLEEELIDSREEIELKRRADLRIGNAEFLTNILESEGP